MKKTLTFEERLYNKLREQIKGKKVGFLLGAGASFLNGSGYPLANELWPAIRSHVPEEQQCLIDNEITRDSSTLGQAFLWSQGADICAYKARPGRDNRGTRYADGSLRRSAGEHRRSTHGRDVQYIRGPFRQAPAHHFHLPWTELPPLECYKT